MRTAAAKAASQFGGGLRPAKASTDHPIVVKDKGTKSLIAIILPEECLPKKRKRPPAGRALFPWVSSVDR